MPKAVFLIDPPSTLNRKKDTTLAIAECAEKEDWEVFFSTLSGLFLRDQQLWLTLQSFPAMLAEASEVSSQVAALDTFSHLFIRKNPPLDSEYLHALQLLRQFSSENTQLINRPEPLMQYNEKLFALEFPSLIPPTVVTRQATVLNDFLNEHRKIVVKPLDGMGGTGIFLVKQDDLNKQVIWETVTQGYNQLCVAQRYLPEIKEGDRRILLLDGEPLSHALVRLPPHQEFRANLAVGGIPRVEPLRAVDRAIAAQVGPMVARLGVRIAGLDVIGSYLTEINVTSPTGMREIQAAIGSSWLTAWLAKLAADRTA